MVAETSVTVDGNNVRRTRGQADPIRATSVSVQGVVIGVHAMNAAVQDSAGHDVAIMILTG